MKFLLTVILIIVVLDVLMVVYILYRYSRKKLSPASIQRVREKWKQIIDQPDHRHAILDADKLLDYALSELGLKGNLGSKLKKSPHLFSRVNDVWKAHKIRNNIAHQIDYQVTEPSYKQTMLYFKQAFKDLGIF